MNTIKQNMKRYTFFQLVLCSLLGGVLISCGDNEDVTGNFSPPPSTINVDFYLTKADQSALFAKQTTGISTSRGSNFPTIEIGTGTTYQEMDGFGFALTGGSAMHLNNMSASKRSELLNELFGTTGSSIGTSYLRISMGASDLDATVFSYNDMPNGQTDVGLSNFSLADDQTHLIPVLKEILAINPSIKILATPWSPPAWMKTNNSPKGGNLKTEYYAAYANYFVKYVRAMAAEGITIDAISIQNEPLHPGNNPSMSMSPIEQSNFIKNNLGPTFQAQNITAKIIIYDHNPDRIDYPIAILDDAEAKQYVDGSAFHLYAGSIESLSTVHNAHPDKNIYFTEQWVGAPGDFPNDIKWHVRELLIGATRNWSKTVIEWNLASNSALKPHTDGGCTNCLGAVTIDGDVVKRNPAYYIIAHAAKFVRPGAVRVDSNHLNELPNVVFKTLQGKYVIIVLNDSNAEQSFNINLNNDTISTTLASGAVGTYVW